MTSTQKDKKSYNQGHPSALDQSHQNKQCAQNLPPCFTLLFPTGQDYNEGDKRHALYHDCERHEKADGAPHGAEITVIVAVFHFWEAIALMGEGGAATVKPVGIVNM